MWPKCGHGYAGTSVSSGDRVNQSCCRFSKGAQPSLRAHAATEPPARVQHRLPRQQLLHLTQHGRRVLLCFHATRIIGG